MIARLARIEAQPQKIDEVREALTQMVRDSRRDDPELAGYALYECEKPGEFLIEQRIPEDTGADVDAEERFMELGTALREMAGPVEIASYRLVTEANQ
jgi:quinol monooxygenase YgiN